MNFDYPIIDLHTHLRNDISKHTEAAKQSGIDLVVYMANSDPPLDSLGRIKDSLKRRRHCQALPVSAITKGLKGKELVDIDKIKPLVVGFSDDGNYLEDLRLLQEILEKEVLVIAHCSPSYQEGLKNPDFETKLIKKYIHVLEKTGGRLHIQHVSKKSSVAFIRKAKKQRMKVTCETCPHYFSYTQQDLEVRINPPLGLEQDVTALKQGLADGTIDVIASDYAPLPRKTGIAGFKSFLPLAYGLVLSGVLTKKQLREKLYVNPKRIIESGNYKIKI